MHPDFQANLFTAAALCLGTRDPGAKADLSQAAAAAWRAGALALEDTKPVTPICDPGRPERPLLVPPRELPRRRPQSPKGRAALVHAVAHIEFNAMNLA